MVFDESSMMESSETGSDLEMDFAWEDTTEKESGFLDTVLEPMRVSLNHEMSYKYEAPEGIVNNRSSVRVEYSKLFWQNYFLQFDVKVNGYHENDHRAEAEDTSFLTETKTREAFLQTSFGDTSVKLGYQILAWGVSEGGVITDVISPRNNSEYFFVSLEESRIGQPMLVIDRFSSVGDWNYFFVPSPEYNEYPKEGTEYYSEDMFGGRDEPEQSWDSEYFETGLRWKKTFGKNDFSVMAATLIDNDYLIRQQRYQMLGMTGNFASGNFLYRAEIGYKKPKAFFALDSETSELFVKESDVLDVSLGFDFSPGGRVLTFSGEIVSNSILDWDESIQGQDENMLSLVGVITNKFMDDDLTVSWMSIYGEPYTNFQHSLRTSYIVDNNLTLFFDMFYPSIQDERSGGWEYRDQKQAVFKIQYQF